MGFDARKWPDAVTIGRLIEQGMPLGVHCLPCGRYAVLDPALLPFAPAVPVPSLDGRSAAGAADHETPRVWRTLEAAPEDVACRALIFIVCLAASAAVPQALHVVSPPASPPYHVGHLA